MTKTHTNHHAPITVRIYFLVKLVYSPTKKSINLRKRLCSILNRISLISMNNWDSVSIDISLVNTTSRMIMFDPYLSHNHLHWSLGMDKLFDPIFVTRICVLIHAGIKIKLCQQKGLLKLNAFHSELTPDHEITSLSLMLDLCAETTLIKIMSTGKTSGFRDA